MQTHYNSSYVRACTYTRMARICRMQTHYESSYVRACTYTRMARICRMQTHYESSYVRACMYTRMARTCRMQTHYESSPVREHYVTGPLIQNPGSKHRDTQAVMQHNHSVRSPTRFSWTFFPSNASIRQARSLVGAISLSDRPFSRFQEARYSISAGGPALLGGGQRITAASDDICRIN